MSLIVEKQKWCLAIRTSRITGLGIQVFGVKNIKYSYQLSIYLWYIKYKQWFIPNTPTPPGTLGPPQLGGCVKRGGVQSFCPVKSTFINFSRFFFTDCWEIFVLSRGGVYSVAPQKSQILVLNREGVFGINFTVYIFYVFFLHFRKKT